MLKHLSITNYALIDHLEIDFQEGFSVLTGETGAGKSIILGALSLILGSRVDTTSLKDNGSKCIIEGIFLSSSSNLEELFVTNDLDYETDTILRREILPSGKSRAFVNDTPVKLKVLNTIGNRLVNIHSQHETLQLSDSTFQLDVLDGYVGNSELVLEYRSLYREYLAEQQRLDTLKSRLIESKRDEDYIRFQLNELADAVINQEEFNELEEKSRILEHAEEIKAALSESNYILNEDESAITVNISRLLKVVEGIDNYLPENHNVVDRLRSIIVELEDIGHEFQQLMPDDEPDTQELQILHEKIDRVNSLLSKHNLTSVSELERLKESFEERLAGLETSEDDIEDSEKRIKHVYEKLVGIADTLNERRVAGSDNFKNSIIDLIKQLGMKDAGFEVSVEKLDNLGTSGMDRVKYLFSANKGGKYGEISKIASGGELSRLMLAVKSMINLQQMLPTVIFDEIDSGISGDIAGKVGKILKQMARIHQVVAITHLPQIASKADYHYKVYKVSGHAYTSTTIRLLDDEGRVEEVSSMLSSEKVTDTARNVAREMINE